MDFSLRRTSFKHSSHGSSSSIHHQSTSYDYNHPECSNPDWFSTEENQPDSTYHHRHHTHPTGGGFTRHSMNSPTRNDRHRGDVIVKIDSGYNDIDDGTDIHGRMLDSRYTRANTSSTTTTTTKSIDENGDNNTVWRRGSSGEFSFPRANDNENHESTTSEDRLSNRTTLTLDHQNEKREITVDKNLDTHEKHVDNSRKGGGLPPLPLTETSNLSPKTSDINIQSSSFRGNNNNHHNHNDGSKDIQVSFQDSVYSDKLRRRTSIYSNIERGSSSSSHDSSITVDEDDQNHSGEVLRRNSSNNMPSTRSFRAMPGISRAKSRLWDPPTTPPIDQRSGRSGQINRSGLLGKSMMEEDDDDPDDDLPDEYRTSKLSIVVVLEWVSLIMIMGALIWSLITSREKKVWNLRVWKWEVLFLVLICGRLVSDWSIRMLVFLIERNFLLRKRLLYFVYGIKKAVQNVIWLGLVLLTWHLLFDEKVEKQASKVPIRIVTRILVIGEIGAILWLLKTLLVKFCASTFHVKAFFDRIQGSLFNQYVIETLSAPPLFELNQEEDRRSSTLVDLMTIQSAGRIDVPHDLLQTAALPRNNSSGANVQTPRKSPAGQSFVHSDNLSNKKENERINVDRLQKLNRKNVSAWNMKRLMRIVRHGGLTTLDEHLVDSPTHEDDPLKQIKSEVEAKAAARKIFQNVTKPGSKHIYLEDLMRFMKDDEATTTMEMFEGANENGRINKRALKTWLVNAFRERRALALTLNDTKSVVHKLHKMMNVIVSVIILLIATIWLKIISKDSVVFLSSQVVLVAFVFGNTCKNVFESIIFLFVIHPYDIGDRCEIEGVQMVVEEINILTTVFLRFDNQKIVYPNYVLITKPINNFYRSPDMGDAVDVFFHISTPPEKIAVMRKRIVTYIEHKRDHWYPGPMVVLRDTDSLHVLKVSVWLQHRINFQDMGERYMRRALLVEECVKIFREMDIDYRLYPINVNVHSMPPVSHAHAHPHPHPHPHPHSHIRSSAFN